MHKTKSHQEAHNLLMEITPTCIYGNGPPHFVNGWGIWHAQT